MSEAIEGAGWVERAGRPSGRTATAFESASIVLPAYNEAARIGPALDELFAYLGGAGPELPRRLEVIVVDDGSSDPTAALVAAEHDRLVSLAGGRASLRVLPIPHGGKGAAVRAGMLASTGEIAIFADADMATPPDELPALVGALGEVDLALGSRIQPDGSDMRASQPLFRRLLGRAFHAIAGAWLTGSVRDTQCGFKGFRREAAREVFERQRIRSIVFDVELIHLARRLGYRIAVVPIRWADRRGSRMRPGIRLAITVGWDLLRIRSLHRGLRRPGSGR